MSRVAWNPQRHAAMHLTRTVQHLQDGVLHVELASLQRTGRTDLTRMDLKDGVLHMEHLQDGVLHVELHCPQQAPQRALPHKCCVL